MAIATIGIVGGVGIGAARPADIAPAFCGGMASDAVIAVSWNVSRVGGRAIGPLGALRGICPVVTGIAPARAHRRMGHRVGRETRRRIIMAIAALDSARGNMGRRRVTGRCCPIVTVDAIGIGRLVDIGSARPGNIAATNRCSVASNAIATRGRDMP